MREFGRRRTRVGCALGTVLKGGTVIEFEPARVEMVDLRVEDGVIVARGLLLPTQPGDDVVDVTGKLVMPGLVCAHHRLHTTLHRAAPLPLQGSDEAALSQGPWKLDAALDLEGVQLSAAMGALEALMCGTTTVVDQHSSPNAIRGSLLHVARGVNEVGLRGVLSYEVTDRYGALGREEGLEENVGFIQRAQGRFRGLVGGHASYTLSNDALEGMAQAAKAAGVGLHIELAEDPIDEKLSVERFGETAVARLLNAGLLTAQSVVAHVVHLSWPELSQLIATGAWIIHNPRSNMERQVGYAPSGKFGARATVGTNGLSGDVLADVKLAHFRAREAGQPIDVLRYLANGHRLASQVFNQPMGILEPGAVADLVVLDYQAPTPLRAETLAQHVLLGFGSRWVESVMVDGVWRLWARRPLSVAAEPLAARAREKATELWQRAGLG